MGEKSVNKRILMGLLSVSVIHVLRIAITDTMFIVTTLIAEFNIYLFIYLFIDNNK